MRKDMDGRMLLKFFFAALSNNKTKSITLPMIDVQSVPDSFVEHLQVEYFSHEDKMKVSIKQKGTIVLPTQNDIKSVLN